MLFGALLWFILCRHLSGEWSVNEQYSYGWFVPFFAAYLFWLRFEDRPEPDFGSRIADCGLERSSSESQISDIRHPRSEIAAAALAATALLLLLPLRLFEVGNPDWRPLGWLHAFIVVALTLLLIWRLGGWPWLKHFAFPVSFILIAVPWISAVETPIVQGLMAIVAAVAAESLNLLGVPAQLEGNLIRVNAGLVGVNEACSGVRSLQTSLMIGLLFGELKRLAVSRRLVLLGGALAIALLCNFGRAFVLVWLSATRGPSAAEQWHDGLGYAIVGAVFVGTMALAALLGRAEQKSGVTSQESAHTDDRPPMSRSRPLTSDHRPLTSGFRLPTFILLLPLLWLLAVEVSVEGWYRIHERNLVPAPQWTALPPATKPGFRNIEIDEVVRGTLRYDDGWQASWPLATAPAQKAPGCVAFFFRWNEGGSSVVRARSHRPDICLPSAGWQQLHDHGTATYSVGSFEIPFRYITFQPKGGGAVAHTFFCLQEDLRRPRESRPDLELASGVQPDWSFKSRIRVVRNGVRNLGQQVLEVIIINDRPMERAEVEQKLRETLRDIVTSENPRT